MRYPILIIGLLSVWSGLLVAKPTVVAVDELVASSKHQKTAVVIGKVAERYHYRDVVLDNKMSENILDRYIDSLDPNKSFFALNDIVSFLVKRNDLDEAIETGSIEPAFTIFKTFRKRVEERVDFAIAQLEKNAFDFSKEESYRYDREDAAWEKSEQALDDLWRRRIKNDILSLRLVNTEEEKIKGKLIKRYQGIKDRVARFNADDVFQTFINAFTLSIEPHTSYMSPRGSENFDISMRLSLQGIGAVLRSDNEYTSVVRTVPGGPANKSNQIKSGDRITGVAQGADGEMEDVVGWRLQDVVEKIRGPKETIVRLSILPKSAGADGIVKEVVLTREKIKLEDQAASSQVLENIEGMKNKRIGVIDIPAFYRDFRAQASGESNFRSTTRDVRNIITELTSKKVDGIIIDLRQNGGGSLAEATELTGLFIKEGPVVQVREASGNIEVERDPDPELVYDGPLLVLVDRNSASASEIFAGAIQDYQRGIIVGEPTFGKGTVQTLVDLGRFVSGSEDLGRLRLTMAQFFRIDGASTQHKGVVPDITFPTASGAKDYGERSLDNALPWAEVDKVEHETLHTVDLAILKNRDEQRIKNNPGFDYLVGLENEFSEIKERHTVSLVETQRVAEWKNREKLRLERRNRLRKYRGLEALTKLESPDDDEVLDDKDEDPEGIERIMLEESALILADIMNGNSSEPVTAQTQ